MAFPTEFPTDAAKAVGNAILNKSFDRTLLEPAYDLQGFAEYCLVGSDAPFPKPTVQSTPGLGLHDDDLARRLIETADLGPDGDGRGVKAMPIPWGQVLSLLLSLIQGALASEATK